MKRFLKWILVSVFTLALALMITIAGAFWLDDQNTKYLAPSALADTTTSGIIINAHVVPMWADTVIENTRIEIKNGIITAIGADLDTTNQRVIDAQFSYVMPGLVDMHVHVWDAYELGLYLANGITTVRNVWGMPMHLRMKKALAKGNWVGPDFFTSGPKLTGPDYLGDDNLQLQDADEAKAKIADYKARGYDFIKTYNGLTPALFQAIVAECKAQNFEIAAHPTDLQPYENHFVFPVKTIEHTEDIVQQPLHYELDTTLLQAVAQVYGQNKNVAHCPTLVVYHNIYKMLQNAQMLDAEALQYMNPLIKRVDATAQFERWHATQAADSSVAARILAQHNFQLWAVKTLSDSGAVLVCGTDAGIGITLPGYSLHRELLFYAEAGLTNFQVLQTATANVAQTHHFLSDIGTIAVGKKANLLFVEANPLQNLAALQNPVRVLVGGLNVPAEQLTTYAEKAKNRSNSLVTLLRYLEFFWVEK